MGASRSPSILLSKRRAGSPDEVTTSRLEVVTRLSDINNEDLAILQFEELGRRERSPIKKTESIESRECKPVSIPRHSHMPLLT